MQRFLTVTCATLPASTTAIYAFDTGYHADAISRAMNKRGFDEDGGPLAKVWLVGQAVGANPLSGVWRAQATSAQIGRWSEAMRAGRALITPASRSDSWGQSASRSSAATGLAA